MYDFRLMNWYLNGMDITQLAGLLQASLSPVVLILGVGLLLLSLSNRFGRVTDRLRDLSRQRTGSPAGMARIDRQIKAYVLRGQLLQISIFASAASVLFASVAVLCVLAMGLSTALLSKVVLSLFAVGVLMVIVSIALFAVDMFLSLSAIQEDLKNRAERVERMGPNDYQRQDQRQDRRPYGGGGHGNQRR